MKYELKPLPYDYKDLEPVISAEIMQLHHDKHHLAYVNGANAALEKLEKARKGEVEIDIKATLRDLSFHASGHVLHEVFWANMRKPVENNAPGADLSGLLDKNFGSVDAFKKEFSAAAKAVEGSGWAMLVSDSEQNMIVMQAEKHNFLNVPGFKPLLVLDVWEHAYYLDYKNDRGSYVDKWWMVVNWEDVLKRV